MNLFSQLPEKFFHGLTSRNREVYVNCMERIYRMSGDAISYKMDASRVREAIAIYLMETQTVLVAEEEGEVFDEPVLLRPAAIIAQLIRYGWLARELQEDQYGEDIYITKPAILMLRFLEELEHPEIQEFTDVIYEIYSRLSDSHQWENDPYIYALRYVYKRERDLADGLRDLNTYVRDTVQALERENTYEAIVDNLIDYVGGGFIEQYARLLSPRQNIHKYRRRILELLHSLRENGAVYELMLAGCMREEGLVTKQQAEIRIEDMFDQIEEFLDVRYQEILDDIRKKIERYILTLVARLRFVGRLAASGTRYSVEKVVRYFCESLDEADEEIDGPALFALFENAQLHEEAVTKPRMSRIVSGQVENEIEVLSDELAEKLLDEHRKAADDPYSENRIRIYTEHLMGKSKSLPVSEIPLATKEDFVSAMAIACYADANHFHMDVKDSYYENDSCRVRDYTLYRGKALQDEEGDSYVE